MDAVLDPPARAKETRKRKPKPITPKLLRYAELRAQGYTQSKAAIESGYSAKQAGSKAERNPWVQRYLLDVQLQNRAKVLHTVAIAMAEAQDTMEFAKEKGNPMAYCKAVELRARLSGLLIDRVEVFSMDLKGALSEAQNRVVSINPAYKQLTEANEQAVTDNSGETPSLLP